MAITLWFPWYQHVFGSSVSYYVIRACSEIMRSSIITVWALSWAKWLIAFATITIPRLIYLVLSYSMTLTVSSPRNGPGTS